MDLDQDGIDERLVRQFEAPHPQMTSFVLENSTGGVIRQINVPGVVHGQVHVLDVIGNADDEVLIPYVRRDSLFVVVVDRFGEKTNALFLYKGEARYDRVDDAYFPWDPLISAFYLLDVNEDGPPELVTVIQTQYARHPRGVLIHAWPSGELLGERIVGAVTSPQVLADVDQDGRTELLTTGYSPDNGATAGGYTDSVAYLIVFELGEQPVDEWHHVINGAAGSLLYEDLNGDGEVDLHLAVSNNTEQRRHAALWSMRSQPWALDYVGAINNEIRGGYFMDLDGDAQKEYVALKPPNEILIHDHRFRLKRQHTLDFHARNIAPLPDAEGVATVGLLVLTEDSKHLVLLDETLRVKAKRPVEDTPSLDAEWISQGLGQPPLLLVSYRSHAEILGVVSNPWYRFYRYRVQLILIGVVIAGVGGGIPVWRRYRRQEENKSEETFQRGGAYSALLLLEASGQLTTIHTTSQDTLGVHTPSRPANPSWVAEDSPALSAFCEHILRHRPAYDHRELSLGSDRGGTRWMVDVIQLPERTSAAWILSVRPLTGHSPRTTDAWPLMAQRVAHDLKNPLTSILIRLQHLQALYREEAPEKAGTYDGHIDHITERIEHLRRMVRNFMKFANLQTLDRQRVDINAFVQSSQQRMSRDLPTDIDLVLKLNAGPLHARIDEEQMQSVLENLAANATNAMPEGGTLTLTTHGAHGLQLPSDLEPRNYVLIEVMDTGVGMRADTLDRLFELGFSTRKEGTGMGLAIVRKIMDDHQGHIEVETELGLGSAITLYVPVD